MPHLKSAKKRMRQNIKRREHNRAIKKVVRKHLKTVIETAQDTTATLDQLKTEALAAVKKLDKAGTKRHMHPNTVARRKSRIARLINAKAKAPAPAPAAKK